MSHGILLIFLVTLLRNIYTVYSQTLELHCTHKAEQDMPLDAMNTPKGVPSTPGYRYPQVPLEVDGYTLAPDKLQLEQVHIYVRHGAFLLVQVSAPVSLFLALCTVPGERTPVGVRLADPPPSIPEHWILCRTARRFHTTLSDILGVSSEKMPITKELDHRVDETRYIRKLIERIDGTTTEGEW
jgi:acid phosphatase